MSGEELSNVLGCPGAPGAPSIVGEAGAVTAGATVTYVNENDVTNTRTTTADDEGAFTFGGILATSGDIFQVTSSDDASFELVFP